MSPLTRPVPRAHYEQSAVFNFYMNSVYILRDALQGPGQGLAVFMSCYDFILHQFVSRSPWRLLSSLASLWFLALLSLAVNYVKVVNSERKLQGFRVSSFCQQLSAK